MDEDLLLIKMKDILDQSISGVRDEIKDNIQQSISGVRDEIKDNIQQSISGIRDEMDEKFEKFSEKIISHMEFIADNIDRKTQITAEDNKSRIQQIAEGHSILERKIDISHQELSNKIDELNNNMKLGFKSVRKDITGLKADMSVVKNFVVGVDEKLNEHEIILKKAR